LLCGVLRASHHEREKWICNIGDDHPDSMRFLFCQAACKQVWPIVQLTDRGFNALTKLVAHVALVVHYRGDSKNRDARLSRDVVNTRRLRAFLRIPFTLYGHGIAQSVPHLRAPCTPKFALNPCLGSERE